MSRTPTLILDELRNLLEAESVTRLDSADVISTPQSVSLGMLSSVVVAADASERLVFLANIGNQTAFLAYQHDAIQGSGIALVPGIAPVPLPLPPGVVLNGISESAAVDVAFQFYGRVPE